jgi:hypothetical protein
MEKSAIFGKESAKYRFAIQMPFEREKMCGKLRK